jgi:hypothetical protein
MGPIKKKDFHEAKLSEGAPSDPHDRVTVPKTVTAPPPLNPSCSLSRSRFVGRKDAGRVCSLLFKKKKSNRVSHFEGLTVQDTFLCVCRG